MHRPRTTDLTAKVVTRCADIVGHRSDRQLPLASTTDTVRPQVEPHTGHLRVSETSGQPCEKATFVPPHTRPVDQHRASARRHCRAQRARQRSTVERSKRRLVIHHIQIVAI